MELKNILKTICVFAILLAINCTTSKTTDADLIYQGSVYDKNNVPVPGISIVLGTCAGGSADQWSSGCVQNQFIIGTATTDAHGHFIIKGKQSKINDYWPKINGMYYNSEGVPLNALPTVFHTQ